MIVATIAVKHLTPWGQSQRQSGKDCGSGCEKSAYTKCQKPQFDYVMPKSEVERDIRRAMSINPVSDFKPY